MDYRSYIRDFNSQEPTNDYDDSSEEHSIEVHWDGQVNSANRDFPVWEHIRWSVLCESLNALCCDENFD